MTTFIPVDYHGKAYPPGIKCEIREIAGHFDNTSIDFADRYSLHTEYSFTKRNLTSDLISRYSELKESESRGIPRLWYSEKWAAEFGEFVIGLVDDRPNPEVIEIHPPFKDYCSSATCFLDRYAIFEDTVSEAFPDAIVCIENRSGSQYSKSGFLVSKIEEIVDLLTLVSEREVRLKFALDYPQLFTAYNYEPDEVPAEEFTNKHRLLEPVKDLISSIHLWGKNRNDNGRWIAHTGNLNTMFADNPGMKRALLSIIREFYDDGVARYFVPEVNSGSIDLQSIVSDCMDAGIKFDGEIYIDPRLDEYPGT